MLGRRNLLSEFFFIDGVIYDYNIYLSDNSTVHRLTVFLLLFHIY